MGNIGYGFSPTHPGEVIKDEIEYRGVSQRQLAKQMGISYTVLNDILNKRRPVTAGTALLFEAALGINADIFMRLQLKYNMQTARQDQTLAQRLEEVRKMTKVV
ncbi:MAG: HigA family addiction module antidote protein [Tannerellaceae bacterium]|jgi:addiction module HigA family antidote|nr:HigA family addiction module antidote protein [Tannerellaceae bacterium]